MNNYVTSQPHSLFQHLRQAIPHGLPMIRCTKSTLVHVSHILEDTILRNKIPAMLFTGFQESSHWHKETQHYQELANVALQVCIFAGKPLPIESHVKQLHIELADDDPLRQEWFLLILSDRFSVLLCGQDRLAPFITNEAEHEFDTIWTFDKHHITQTLDILEKIVQQYRPDKLAQLQQARQTYTLSPPDESLLSQFFIDVLNHENTLNREIRKQQTLLDITLNRVNHYVVIAVGNALTRTGNIEFLAGDFEKLFGHPVHVNDNPFALADQFVHPDDLPSVYEKLTTMQVNERMTYEHRCIQVDGRVIWVRVTIYTTAVDQHNQRVYAIIEDTTEWHEMKHIEMQKRQLETELQHERQQNITRNYFINSIMHDFRNPLASMLLASEMLERYKDKMSDEHKEKRLKIIQTQIVQLRDMLDDMSLILNNQLSELGFHPVPHHVVRYMEELITHFHGGHGALHLLILEDHLTPEQHLLDLRLLKYIVPPIIRNAIDFSAPGTPITCKVFREGDNLIISVADEGIGIPKDDQPYIFEPMFRAKNIPTTQHGAGLGLTIAQECVQLHNGKIEFESTEGVGSVFRVIIPYMPALF